MPPIRSVVQTLADPGERIDPRVDFVELRLDLYPDLDAARFVARSKKPVVACVRRRRDGGRFDGEEAERGRLLQSATGAAYLDLEVDAGFEPDEDFARLVSFHDLAGVPHDLEGMFERCLGRGADQVKIAATPRDATDAFRLLDLPTPGLGLGAAGAFTRFLAPWTYCAREPVAPGMPTPAEMFDEVGLRRLGLSPALFGVAGRPVAHSRGPAIHNAAFGAAGRDAVYLRFEVDDLPSFWRVFRAHGGRGLSITAPLKEQAAALATVPDDAVAACGAANTLLADGRAYNTDHRAFLELLPPGSGEKALVMGAGGAARAAVLALRELGYSVGVWNRSPARAQRLRETPALADIAVLERPAAADVVVNTTPLDPPAAPFVLDLRYGDGVDAGLGFLEAQARPQVALFRRLPDRDDG